MTKPLPSLTTLIRDSWNLYTANWNASLKFSIWILYIGLATFCVLIIPPLRVLLPAVQICSIFAMLWATIRLMRATLAFDMGKPFVPNIDEMKEAARLILPIIWASMLQFCIVLGGLIALIIPGVYLSLSLSFSNFAILDQNKRGLAALQESRRLVKGRWWATLGRFLIGTAVIGFGFGFISGIIMTFILLIIGTNNTAGLMTDTLSPAAEAVTTLFQSIIQAIAMPLIIGYQVKLYRALTQNSETI